MSLSPDVTFDIASACVCATLIFFRCGYRLLSRCNTHMACHRTWHIDDAYMAFALLPLAGRTSCIVISFVLNPTHTHGPPSEAEAAARHMTAAALQNDYNTANKLLLPGRICYALFLWSLKLCLLNFYARFVHILHRGKAATYVLWWFIVISFIVTMIPTLAECRPLHLIWAVEKHSCQRALGNLVTMAVFNILTDIALIIFPFPILRYVRLDKQAKYPLIFLFCIAGLVVAITIIRLPLILNQSVSQQSRSMWASIEILCACIVANTAFFYSLFKDIQKGHDSRVDPSSTAPQNSFYMHTIPSRSGQVHEPRSAGSSNRPTGGSISRSIQSMK